MPGQPKDHPPPGPPLRPMCSPSGLLRVGDLGLGGDLNQRRRILVQPGCKFLAAFRGMVIGNPCGITAVLRSIPSCGGDAPRL